MNSVAILQIHGDSYFSCQGGEHFDKTTVLGFAASLQGQLTACLSEKMWLEAELAGERASKADVQFQCDSFAELASHFALVSRNALPLPNSALP